MHKKKYNIFTKSFVYLNKSNKQLSLYVQNNSKKNLFRTIGLSHLYKRKKINFAINDDQIYLLNGNESTYDLSKPLFKLNTNQKYLQKLKFLSQANKIGFERVFDKTKKSSIDWHSNDLLRTNQGIWFYNCFQPFSTRKYWWILLPSQSLLFRLRWETLAKFNFSNKMSYQKWNSLKLQQLNWFHEKPLYIYWIVPFFGCLNLLSVSFSKEIGETLQWSHSRKTNFNSYSFFNVNKREFSSEDLQSLNTTTFSWETINYLSYKKNLLDLSFKFLKKINCYHDSIIYEVSPSWFNSLQEQYVGIYAESDKYSNILSDYNQPQNKIFQKNNALSKILTGKSINIQSAKKYKKKSSTFKTMQLWWNKKSFETNLYLRKISIALTEIKKENGDLINKTKKNNNLVEMITKPLQKSNSLSVYNSTRNELIWDYFCNKNSELKWCWYKLSMANIPFFSINYTNNLRYKSNQSRFLWEKYVGNVDYKLNLVEKNIIQYSRTKNFFNNISLNPIFSSSLGFQKLDLLNINFDEFGQKILPATTSIPLNYLSHTYSSNENFIEFENFNLPLIDEKSNMLNKYQKVNFNLKKLRSEVFSKKATYVENYLLSNNVNFQNVLIGIHSEKLNSIPQSKKSFFSKFYSKTIKEKNKNQNLIFDNKSTFVRDFSEKVPVTLDILKDFNSPLSSILENTKLGNFSFSWIKFRKSKQFLNEFLNFKKSKIHLKTTEVFNNFGVLNEINQSGIFDIHNNFDQNYYNAFKDYLKASFIYDNLSYKFFLNSQNEIFLNKMTFKNNTLQSRTKSKTFFKTTKKKDSDIFLTKQNGFQDNFFKINLSKETLYKLKFPIVMSGYLYPETINYNAYQPYFINFLNQVSLFLGFSPIKKIKRVNGLIKVTIPPSVLILKELEKTYFKKPHYNFTINQNFYLRNNPFCSKVLNFDNITGTKNYLYTKNSSVFDIGQKPIKLIKLGLFDITNNFMNKTDLKIINSDLVLNSKKFSTYNSSSLGYRFKYVGNWSFYWNYFKNFYGSSNILKPFNDIFYFTNFYNMFSNNFKKIGINQVLPGNNFLYKKWHPRKREGFFYKRINKLNVKNSKPFQLNKSLNLQPSISKYNSIVELLWGFRAKYKLDEVLQYQKSKYYQSKKAQQTTNDQNDNQITNNSKITLQNLTKSLIKRKRYKKYMRFELLSEWLRDVLYFRKMSRKVFFTKKDYYFMNISQLIQKSKRGRFNQKYLNLKDSFKKLYLSSNLEQMDSLNKENFTSVNQMRFFNKKPVTKLILKLRKKRIINASTSFFNKNINFESRNLYFKERWINNKKVLLLTKRILPFQQFKSSQRNFKNKQKSFFSQRNGLYKNFSFNLKTTNLSNSSLVLQNRFNLIIDPLISTHDSYLYIFDSVGGSNSSTLKKLYLNNSNNRVLKVPKSRNFVLLTKQIKNVGSFILKNLNNYLINIMKKLGKELKRTVNLNIFSTLDDKQVLKLKNKFMTKIDTKLDKNSYFNIQQNKILKSSIGFYFLNESSTQIFDKSKKLVHLLNSKPFNNDFFYEKNTKYIFKNFYLNYFKTNVKNNWIKKVYRNSNIIKINNNNTKNAELTINKKSKKSTNSQINYLTSILTKFKNFSSSFVLWRNKFQIRRDYLFLSYIYLDYLGALINSVVHNSFDGIVDDTVFSEQNSKFVLMNNFKFFNKKGTSTYFNSSNRRGKYKINKILPSSYEKFYFGSKLYKNNIIKPKWSFLIMNHLKRHHFTVYEKIIQTQNKESNNFVIINKNNQSSTVFKFEKHFDNLDNVISRQNKELKQKKLLNDIKTDLQLNESSSINLLREPPSVVFYRSMVESYTTNSNYFTNLRLKDQTKYLPVIDSSLNNNSYIKNQNQNYRKKILFMKKQHQFQKFYGSILRPLIKNGSHKKMNFQYLNSFDHKINRSNLKLSKMQTTSRTFSPLYLSPRKSNLKVKLRRKIGVFKARILNKKTKIYNGTYLPNLQFANVSLFIDSFNVTKNQFNTKMSIIDFLEESFSVLSSQIKINNFWLCTIILHVCIIFTLLTIYKSSIHFCIKSLYSTLFVLNKYFIYAKYRIHRLLKYIYQNNFQSIIENIQEKYLQKSTFSLYSILKMTVNFLVKRNSAFLIPSRFKTVNRFHLLSNSKEMGKLNFNLFSSISFGNKLNYFKFVRFFHYLKQKNQNKSQVQKMQNYILGNQNFSTLESFFEVLYLRSIPNNIKYKFKFRNFKEIEMLENLGLNKTKKKSESKNFKFTFQVLRWNMFLTLLIGESEILAELEPYREMHWYFLKRFPVFLRTAAGKDSIGMVDYQADEKIRLIKQKIRQTIMILYLRSRNYESKLQNQANMNEKTNKSFLKNQRKTAKWSKDSIIQKVNKQDLHLDISSTEVEMTTNLEQINKDFSVKIKKSIFDSIFRKISIKLLKKSSKPFSFAKRKKSIRKISTWKSILTFLGKLSFISRYAKLNKRFRNSIMLFSNPLVFFGPLGTIIIPYLIKSFFLVFESKSQFTQSFFSNVKEHRNHLKKTELIRKNPKLFTLGLKNNLFTSQLETTNNQSFCNKNFFDKSLKSKLIQMYNSTNPFYQETELKPSIYNLSDYSFENHLGNLNMYIREKMRNFENLSELNNPHGTFLSNTSFNNNRIFIPLFERGFLTNCFKFLNKYERIYFSLNKINILNKNGIKKSWLRKAFTETKFNPKRQTLFTSGSSQNLLQEIDISNINPKKSRFINFDTFDPKLRYYRFYTNFSKVLSDVGGLRGELTAHQQLGPFICKVYAGLFLKQRAKNYLLVSGLNKTESLLFIVQALAGEMGMKLFLEDAKRLQRIGRRGINKATKRLEKLFDIAQANTPCLVFIEDIHVIGSKTKMIKVDEEQEDEEILVRSLLSKLIYRKYHKNKSLRETFIDQNLFTGGFSGQRRKSLKPANPIPKDLVLYQLTRRRAFSNYFLNSNSQLLRINTKLFMVQKLSPAFTTNAVLIWKLFKSKIATPNKSIKEAAWIHIPVDALRSIHPLTYSIRVKIAKITLLAIFTMGTRLRLVKDLIRLFEKTHSESHHNFVVFATTTKLSYMDPSLRRPGRLEETIYFSSLTSVSTLVRSSIFQSKLDNFKTYLKDLPGFSFTFNLIDNTIFSSRLNLKELSVINYLAEDVYEFGISNSYSLNNKEYNFLPKYYSKNGIKLKQEFLDNIKEKFNKYQSFSENKILKSNVLKSNNLTTKLKKQRMTSYETLNTGAAFDYWQMIFANIILQRKKGLFNSNIHKKTVLNFLEPVINKSNFSKNTLLNKFDSLTFFSTYRKNKSSILALLAYTQVGQNLVSFLPPFSFLRSVVQDKNDILFDPDQITNLQLWPGLLKPYELKPQNIYFNRRKTLKSYFLRFFSTKVGEFLFTNPIEWDNINSLENRIDYARSFSKDGFLNSINGIQPNWSLAHSYIMNLITTSCLYSKSPLINKLLRIEDVSKPRQKQFFESLNAGILFEYSDFHYRTFLKKNMISMEENLNILQYQKFMLNNQGRPLRKYVELSTTNRLWLFRILFTELGSLNEISLRPTSMNYYYRNKIVLKQKLKLSSYQWLNWHLRKPLDQLEEIQDIAYFPCAEKFYNPRHRRWMITNGYWGYWFTFDKIFYQNLYEQYILESFYKVFLHLDKNRELLDYLAQLLITQETISETELILSFKRYSI